MVYADQSANGGTVTWGTQRWMGAGAVSADITDITITSNDVNGGTNTHTFAYADYEISLYWRAGANSQTLGSRVFRKYWGQDTGWWNIATNNPAGNYSLQTRLVGAYNSAGQKLAFAANPWVAATFGLSYP